MPANCCPKTCNQLAVAAILISVGIVQLIAGILLLKSEDIHLLAGTDFVAATSNVLVGSLLGISANVWEKKQKVATFKNTARQNVLAGLYIAVLCMNVTVAIIMILGDGSTLLTSKDNKIVTDDFMFEILACAYVTSVCSPIVCLVIALVCLSGNRIRIYENMKKKNNLTKKVSYGWVFENNPESQSRKPGAIPKESTTRNASVSDDNVFVEKKSIAEKFFKIKPSKKDKAKDSFSSLSELKSPLEIWAHKRNKIIKEITSPKPIFFADDYLQFPPDHKYESYIGTLIPRITKSSIIKTNNRDSTQAADSKSLDRKTDRLSNLHLDELNLKLASRRMSYPDTANFSSQVDGKEHSAVSPKTVIENGFDEPDAHSALQRTHANSVGQLEDCLNASPNNVAKGIVDNQSSSDWLYNLRRNSDDSVSSGLTAETINELKAKIKSKANLDENENLLSKPEFFKSFKHDPNRGKYHLSESDLEDKRTEFEKLHDQYGIFSKNSESDSKTELAGEIVPISIKSATIDRVNSIPLKTICSQSPSRYSLIVKYKSPDQTVDTNLDHIKQVLHSDQSSLSPRNDISLTTYEEKCKSQPAISFNNTPTRYSEKIKQRMAVMASIDESPTEEFLKLAQCQKRRNTDDSMSSYSSAPEENNNETDSPQNEPKHSQSSSSRRQVSLKAAPSLLNRLWSMKRSEAKTDLSNLIMDSDSLVGLSDDDLMARSRRLRQLRKSVELRLRDERHEDVV